MMLLAALKSQEVIRSVIEVDKNVGFIRNAIESTITFARNLIIHRLKQHASDGSFLSIGHQDALWLGRGAFQTIFEHLGPTGVLPASNMMERRLESTTFRSSLHVNSLQLLGTNPELVGLRSYVICSYC
ncbi:hypothetical protein MHU86_15457 [Fragilaria crotonensis]|nr:hypothetical protein MHU86_15457 [Fragilaria crotonensis]